MANPYGDALMAMSQSQTALTNARDGLVAGIGLVVVNGMDDGRIDQARQLVDALDELKTRLGEVYSNVHFFQLGVPN